MKHEIYDLDVFVYRCGFAAEKKTYVLDLGSTSEDWEQKRELNKRLKEDTKLKEGDDYLVWVHHQIEPVEYALANFRSSIRRVHERIGGSKQTFYLSGKGNFREKLAKTRPYKGNRDPSYKPVHYDARRDWAIHRLGARVTDGIEADDAVAIDAHRAPEDSVIISNDKDLRQISCWHYDWTKEGEPEWVEPKSARMKFYEQLITGDATDNIEGIPGYGPSKATRLLTGVGSPTEAEMKILEEYKKVLGVDEGPKRFEEMAHLVYILREEGKAWEPRIKIG